MRKLTNWVRSSRFGKSCAVATGALMVPMLAKAADPTDITGVITALDGYRTSVLTIAILILLFVVGRPLVKKFVK